MDKPVVIVNPRSGGGLDERRFAAMCGDITAGLGAFDTRFTKAPGDATTIALDEARAGRKLVVAFGGDGTINEVAEGLLRAGGTAELGILPRGTGGDFRRTLDLPRDLGKAAARIAESAAHTCDVGKVTYTCADGSRVSRHFVNVASFGFSAAVATKANRSSKKLGGKVAFLSATVAALLENDPFEVRIAVDGGEPVRRSLLLGAFGNGRYFGGGMKIAPNAKLDCGTLDLVLVEELGTFDVLTKVHRLFAGTHIDLPQVRCAQIHRVEVEPVETGAVIPVEIDGETPGQLPATFEVLPGALRIRF